MKCFALKLIETCISALVLLVYKRTELLSGEIDQHPLGRWTAQCGFVIEILVAEEIWLSSGFLQIRLSKPSPWFVNVPAWVSGYDVYPRGVRMEETAWL